MDRKQKLVRLADVMMLAADKTRGLADDRVDDKAERVWGLAVNLDAIADELLALAELELVHQTTSHSGRRGAGRRS